MSGLAEDLLSALQCDRQLSEPGTAVTARARHRRDDLPCGTNLYTLDAARSLLADPMRDRRYLETKLGKDVADYLAWKKLARQSPRTQDTRERILARLAVAVPDGVGVAELSVEHLILHNNTIPEASWRLHRVFWKDFIRWAIQNDRRTAKNPVDLLPKLGSGGETAYKVFDDNERDLLVDAARHMDDPVRDRVRILLIEASGCRKGELRAARVRDVSPTNRTFTVIGKGNRERVIPIRGDFWIAWEHALQEPLPRQDRCWQPDDHIWFPTRVAGAYKNRARQVTASNPEKPMTDGSMHEWWARLVDHAGIPYRRLHMTRHTFCTDALDASKGDIYGVQQLAGHKSIKTTELYLHSSRVRKEYVVDRLAKVRRTR